MMRMISIKQKRKERGRGLKEKDVNGMNVRKNKKNNLLVKKCRHLLI